MKWKTHKYYAESDAGYKISKAHYGEVVMYTPCAPLSMRSAAERGVNYEIIGDCTTDPKAAADACETHYARQTAARSSGVPAVAVNNEREGGVHV